MTMAKKFALFILVIVSYPSANGDYLELTTFHVSDGTANERNRVVSSRRPDRIDALSVE